MKENSPKYQISMAIAELEEKKLIAFDEMKVQFYRSYESMRPINLLKSTINDLWNGSADNGGFGNNMIGVLSGLIVKNIVFRRSYNPIKIAAGITLQALSANFAEKNADIIKKAGKGILQIILYKIKSIKKQKTTI